MSRFLPFLLIASLPACIIVDGGDGTDGTDGTHSGEIGTETWAEGVHLVESTIRVTGTLTLDPCVEVRVASGASIDVEDGGQILAPGTEDCPILITSAATGPGPADWSYLALYSSASTPAADLDWVTVEYAGDNYGAIYVDNGASLEMDDSTVRFSGDVGIELRPGAELDAFSGNTLIDNALGAMELDAEAAGAVQAGTYTPNDIEGIVINDGLVGRDTTWIDPGVPWVIAAGLRMYTDAGSAILTVEPGATLAMGDGEEITVDENGGLTLPGTMADPITITSAKASPARGDFAYVEFFDGSIDSANDFDHVIVEYGGTESYGMFWIDDGASLALTDSTVRESLNVGIEVVGSGTLRDVTGNTFVDNTDGPILLSVGSTDALGEGTWGPNDVEGIRVRGSTLTTDVTWPDLGVPWVIEDSITLNTSAGSAILTVEAGATLAMGADANIEVENNGALVLDGTSAAPILVTSAKSSPAAGDWGGLWFYDDSVGATNSLSYVDIEYGGGTGYGQLYLDNGATVSLTEVVFSDPDVPGCDIDDVGGTIVDGGGNVYSVCP